jgi:hypothetical protein
MWSAQGRRRGFRRRLIRLLYAGWIPASTVIRLGLPMSNDGRRLSSATSYLLGFPTVASPPALCTLYLHSSIFLLKVRLFTEVQLVSRRPLLPIHGMAALCSAALSGQAPTPARSRRVCGARA